MNKIFAFVVLLASGCASYQTPKTFFVEEKPETTFERTFNCDKETLWLATVSALENYTLVSANREKGFLRTDMESQRFNQDVLPRTLASSEATGVYRSRINTQIVPSGSNFKLQITKTLLKFDNQLGLYRHELSDGIEEAAIFALVQKSIDEKVKK
jgi:hypothetical protein